MLRNMDFNIAAIAILLFIYLFFRIKYHIDSYSGRYFRILVATIMVTAVLCIISDRLLLTNNNISQTLIYSVYGIYLIFVVGCSYVMVEYTRALVTNSHKVRLFDIFNQFLMIFHIVMCLLTIHFHYYVEISGSGSIIRGKWYVLIYLISGYYLICSMLRMHIHFSRENHKLTKAVAGFVIVSFTGAVCQYFFFEDNLIIYFVYAISTIILLFSFETPDFHELIRTTKELEESQIQLQSLKEKEDELSATVRQLSKVASWVIYFDENGQITESKWSPEIYSMMGYEEGEYTEDATLLWQNSLYPEDKEMAINSFMAGIQGGTYDIETRMIDRRGEIRWYRCTGEIKLSEDGVLRSYQGLIRDIDDEKSRQILNDEKIKALEELERSQEELRKALFAAEEANRAKTVFLSNMSHDIRTPMNAIIGYTQLARENIDNTDEVRNCLETINSSGGHLLALINDVLDMSRIESGKMKVENSPCDLVRILEDIEGMTHANIEEKNQNYISDYSNIRNRYVLCDRLRINQILINCIGNAIKYTPDNGSISVTLTEEAAAEDGFATYLFSVKDNGIGMTEEFLAKVFEPFERDKSTRLGQIQGTGLGMAITKNLVQMMGGTITAESEVDKGSEFLIRIPLKIITRQEVISYGENAEGVSLDEMVTALKGKKFLVVDDNKLNRNIVRRILESRGMIIEECDSGQSAVSRLEKVEDSEFDMVFMDIQMPGMNGYETTDIIRASDRDYLKNIKIIAMTANAFEEDKRNAKEHGMNGHVTKPFKLEELVKQLYILTRDEAAR